MRPLILLLLVVQCALCAPQIDITLQDIGQVPSNSLIDASAGVVDLAETNPYVVIPLEVANDMVQSGKRNLQAIACGQVINLLAELSSGIPGDSCDYAAMINAAAAGNPRAALGTYVNRVLTNIDILVAEANNPSSLKLVSGPRGGCPAGGRNVNIEAAWEIVLENSNPSSIGILSEQLCAARRLTNGYEVRNNNIGLGITAAAIPLPAQVINLALGPVANLLRALGSTGNPAQAAAQAKAAIRNAVSRL